MNLRLRCFLIDVVLLLVLLAGLWFLANFVVTKGMIRAEKERAVRIANRTIRRLDYEQGKITQKAGDWSVWQDAARFVRGQNPDFQRTQVHGEAFISLGIDFMAFLNAEGAVVWGKSYDETNQAFLPLPKGLLASLSKDRALKTVLSGMSEKAQGLLRLPGGIFMVSLRAVREPGTQGLPDGALIVGLFLDEDEQRRFSSLDDFPVRIQPLGSPLASAVEKLPTSPGDVVVMHGKGKSVARTFLVDLEGSPVALMSVEIPYLVTPVGSGILRIFGVGLLLLFLVYGAAHQIFLNRSVIGRLRAMCNQLRDIRSSKNLATSLSVPGSDEISRLAEDINDALDALKEADLLKASLALLEEEARYRQELFENALNGMAVFDPLTFRHFEVNSALAELLGYPKETLLDSGFDFLGTFVREDVPRVKEALETVRTTKTPFRYEVRHLRKDGEHRHVLAQISMLTRRKGWESDRCLVVVVDISEVRHQATFFGGLSDLSPVGLFTTDIETGKVLDANPAFLDMLGYSKEELLSRTWFEITPSQIVKGELEENEALLRGNVSIVHREKTFFKKDGTELPVLLYFGKFFDPRQGKEVYAAFVVNLSGIKKAQERLDKAYRYFKTIFDMAGEMLIIFDEEGRVRDVNKAAELLLGFGKEELLGPGFDWRRLVRPDDLPCLLDAIETVRRGNASRRIEARGFRKDGSEVFLFVSYTLIEGLEEDSGGRHILGVHVDITEIKRLEAELQYLSFHDALTGIFNRAYFEQELDRLSKGRKASVGVVVADLDNLKPVNDTLGHAAGDALLKRAANALRRAFRAEDIVARVGGDEFAVVLTEVNSEVMERALARLEQEVARDNLAYPDSELSLSVGYALAKENPFPAEALYRAADSAMYQKKFSKKKGLPQGSTKG